MKNSRKDLTRHPGGLWQRIVNWLGIERGMISHRERLASIAGGFIGILIVFVVCRVSLGQNNPLLIASIGASAVLLFAVPHGALSQPWAFAGGHLVSAIAGVVSFKLVHNPIFSIPLSVAGSIGLMHYLRCIHPPGGATALTAVIGGPQIQSLGFTFILDPVLINVALLLATAVAFNYLFAWRRYPASLMLAEKKPDPVSGQGPDDSITHADLVYALSQVDSFIDVTEHDLLRIYDLATQRHRRRAIAPAQIQMGHCYSNGKFGDEWSVRQIVDESHNKKPERDKVIYKVVAGQGRRTSGVCTRTEFAHWAQDRVERQEYYWQKVTESEAHT